jgi:hemerythrin superfamily protein
MASQRPESMAEEDVIDLLLHQHVRIRELFGEVESSTGDARRDAFGRLVRLLAVHETAEEIVVHPVARRALNGEPVVEDRLREEHDAKELLSRLDEMGPDAAEFMPLLRQLHDAVVAHAGNEERFEFPSLRERVDETQRRRMAKAVKAAEAMAPTRPRPGVETPAENILVGTPAAMMDRVRDVVRKAMPGG